MIGLLVTYGLTISGVVISVWRPWYSLLIYIAFGILRPESLWHWSVPPGRYSFVIAVSFLTGWVIHGFGDRRLPGTKTIILCILVFWMLSLSQALLFPSWPPRSTEIIRLSKILLPLIAGTTLIRSVTHVKQICWVIVIAQGYLAFQFNSIYYERTHFNADSWHFAGLDNNGIAITMSAAFGLALFLGLSAHRWYAKSIAFTMAILMAHVILFSMSRGGMLALAISLAAAAIILPKRPLTITAYAIGTMLILGLAGPPVVKEFRTVFVDSDQLDASARTRLDQWRACLEAMGHHPFFGVGIGRWPYVSPQFGMPAGVKAHNTWLQLGAEYGIPALCSLLGVYWITTVKLYKIQKRCLRGNLNDEFLADASRGIIVSLIGFFVSASFVSVVLVETPYYVLLAGIGVIQCALAEP